MSKPGARCLQEMLARNHDIAQRIDARGFPLAAFESLQSWQRKRIGRSYADLVQLEGFGPAVHFFLTELYGGLDFRERDQDIGKVMPVMIRFLPDRALQTMAEAFELQAISLEFDMAMAAAMVQRGTRGLDMAEYCEIYRSANDRGGRERQITLIRKLGYDLDQVVRWPLVNYLVRLLRGPAHAAGFGRLQEFLEQGLASFRALDDTGLFVETIYEREWSGMASIFAGSDKPYGF
jgi:hypothetical protein